MGIAFPFSRPLYVMAKPAGAQCNLHCAYCYYKEKGKLYAGSRGWMMDERLLEKFVKEYIEAQTTPCVLFTWHGGEPLLQPRRFYERALMLQRHYAGGRQIDNCIQTNGTLLSDDWCRFFKDNGFLVGISIDGDLPLHDAHRRNATGGGTFQQVMRGIEMLQRHGVEWNGMAVVNHVNVQHPLDFYQFFRRIGCHYLQFAPIVERTATRSDGLTWAPGMQAQGQLSPLSVSAEQWGEFLCTVFDEWVKHDVGEYFVQLFDATLANWVGEAPGVCTLSAECGHVGVLEHNGDLYSCDHFVYPEYLLGNLHRHTITEMMHSARQQQFARYKRLALPRQCKECRYLFACHGECPKNRFLNDRYGEFGLNYLCQGYHRFFEHAAPYMDRMARLLGEGKPPSWIMEEPGRQP